VVWWNTIAEAETLQQRAERQQKIELFQQSRSKFEEALSIIAVPEYPTLGISPDQVHDCRCLLAEVLQNTAELLLRMWAEDCRGATTIQGVLGDYTIENEFSVFSNASSLFSAAVEQYRATVTDATQLDSMRVDCLVNLGNTLAGHASLYTDMLKEKMIGNDCVVVARRMFVDSRTCYDSAILKEDDSATWNNRADMLIDHAEFETEFGNDADSTYEASIQSYGKACELCSSAHGDNLSALLNDWGSGLLSVATYVKDVKMDRSASQNILLEAEKRLLDSVSFDRASTAPHAALGDVYMSMSENLFEMGDVNNAMVILQKALDDGYGMALRIQRTYTDALVGVAEAMAWKAKMLQKQGLLQDARSSLETSVSMYQQVISSGKLSGTLRERSDLLYNLACCLCGIPDRQQEAVEILELLCSKQLVSKEEILQDTDLKALYELLN
jgi:tetratricopeptide (TPR) repeat protein